MDNSFIFFPWKTGVVSFVSLRALPRNLRSHRFFHAVETKYANFLQIRSAKENYRVITHCIDEWGNVAIWLTTKTSDDSIVVLERYGRQPLECSRWISLNVVILSLDNSQVWDQGLNPLWTLPKHQATLTLKNKYMFFQLELTDFKPLNRGRLWSQSQVLKLGNLV